MQKKKKKGKWKLRNLKKTLQDPLRSLPLKQDALMCNLSLHFRVYTEKKFLFKRSDH